MRLAHAGLWALVLTSVLASVVGFRRHPARSPEPVVAADRTSGVSSFAELFVAAFLRAGEGTEEGLAPFLGGPVELRAVEPGSLTATRTTVAGVEPGGDGYWAVTVAAEVAGPGGQGVADIRYYEVGVTERPDGLAAAALPAQVPPPPRGDRPSLAGPSLGRPERGDPVAVTVEGFLQALLTGERGIDRYATPGSALRAIRPAPFQRVALERLAGTDGADRFVRAEVRGQPATGGSQLLQYELGLHRRAGRWEVASISGAPRLDDRRPVRTPQPSPTPPAPTTSDPLPPASTRSNEGETP